MVGRNDYHATLIHFMTFMNGIAYAKDHHFIQDELAPLTPDNVARWMCQKAYGTPEPDANPTQARFSSLHCWKKAISYYMPNRLMQWNAISGQRNPTRSTEVNTLIKKVKKKEVRKERWGPRLDVPLRMLNLGGCKVSSGRRMMYFSAMVFRAY
jgi:hypothetical protein